MTRFLQLIAISLLLFSCSRPQKEEAQDDEEQTSQNRESEKQDENTSDSEKEDEYKIVFRKIDNRVMLHVDDSLIYDSGTIGGNPDLGVEIFLSKYVAEGKSEIRVDGYNGVEPYNQVDSSWEIVYDIYLNDEIVEFVRDVGSDGSVGKVFSETYDLKDLY